MATKKVDGTVVTDVGEAVPDAQALTEFNDVGESISTNVSQNMTLGGFDGDVDDVLVKLPYLKISYAQGKLEAFRKGSLVLGDSDLLANPGDVLRITILSARAYWKEYVSGTRYDPSYVPKNYATKREVLAAGGTVVWDNVKNLPPTYKLAVFMNILIEQPEGVTSGRFGIKLGGKTYAPASWSVDKTSAAAVAPVLKDNSKLALRERGLHSGIFELSTHFRKFDSGFSSSVPELKLVGHRTDAEIAEIVNMFSSLMNVSAKIDDADAAETISARI